jgi:hypothetical protein
VHSCQGPARNGISMRLALEIRKNSTRFALEIRNVHPGEEEAGGGGGACAAGGEVPQGAVMLRP